MTCAQAVPLWTTSGGGQVPPPAPSGPEASASARSQVRRWSPQSPAAVPRSLQTSGGHPTPTHPFHAAARGARGWWRGEPGCASSDPGRRHQAGLALGCLVTFVCFFPTGGCWDRETQLMSCWHRQRPASPPPLAADGAAAGLHAPPPCIQGRPLRLSPSLSRHEDPVSCPCLDGARGCPVSAGTARPSGACQQGKPACFQSWFLGLTKTEVPHVFPQRFLRGVSNAQHSRTLSAWITPSAVHRVCSVADISARPSPVNLLLLESGPGPETLQPETEFSASSWSPPSLGGRHVPGQRTRRSAHL